MTANSPDDRSLIREFFEGAASLPKPVVDLVCELGRDLLGPGFGQAGALIGDRIYKRRISNRIKAVVAVVEQAQASGLSLDAVRAGVPEGWACDVLEAMETIDDDGLRELWARLLLAPVKDPGNAHPAFIDLLRRLSPSDAVLFEKVATGAVPSGLLRGMSGPPRRDTWVQVLGAQGQRAEIERLEAFGICIVGTGYEQGTPPELLLFSMFPLGHQLAVALGLRS